MAKKRTTTRKTRPSTKKRTSGGRRSTSGRTSGSRRRAKKNAAPLPFPHLTLDRWLDILGYTLCAVAGLTLLSFLSANNGKIPGWWLGILRRGFGWGAYLTPLLIGAVGLWLILREFGDRVPRPTPYQTVGVLLAYQALLTTLHLMAAWTSYSNDLAAVAAAGAGGGKLGSLLAAPLLEGLGVWGTVVVLLTWWLVAAMLTFEIKAQDIAVRLPPPRPRPTTSAPKRRQKKRPSVPSPSARPPTTEPVIAVKPAKPSPSTTPPRPRTIGEPQGWRLPSVDEILDPGTDHDSNPVFLRQQARVIEETLASLGAPVKVREINPGPVVTQFGIEPLVTTGSNGQETRVKVSRIKALADDLALALEAKTLRVEAPIPGKGLIGIEVPNPEITLVSLREVLESPRFAEVDSPLKLCLGENVSGHPVVADLTAMPHLLIAGTTGSGKSVCINGIIASLLLRRTPDELQLLLVDPKRVELTGYEGIPHLVSKVVVDVERVPKALKWIIREMENRYRHFSGVQATDIRDYNERVAPALGEKPLPYIVVVIDELADLMIMSPQETERAISRIAQMARATGIHLIIATQRPSVDVVTGLIKANFPARISFNVASAVDSRVILDMPGAEQLLGRGDMLFLPPDAPRPLRLQGAFVSDEELRRLVHYWKGLAQPRPRPTTEPVQKPLWEEDIPEPAVQLEDELLPEVIELVLREQRASISLLQRKLRIGYTRASRIMDILEEHGVVGPQPPGGKAREVFPAAAQALLTPRSETGGRM